MHASGDPDFQKFLLAIGNGQGIDESCNEINLPQSMVIHGGCDQQNIDSMINQISPNISSEFAHPRYFMDCSILCFKNSLVNQINSRILNIIPSEKMNWTSSDTVEDDPQGLYLPDYINSLKISGFPPHILPKGCSNNHVEEPG